MASEKILNGKKEVVSEIKSKITDSQAVIFFDYRGLTDAEFKELRIKLKDSGSELKVYKNTLTTLALRDLKFEVEDMTGPKAMAYSSDLISPIKVLAEYAKKHKALEIKMGILENELADIKTINQLATIPNREGLLTMLAGGLIGLVKDLAIGLDMVSEQKK